MHPGTLPVFYQCYYIVIPTISLIGNSAIVYVTVRSRSLRSPCNILIGLISLGESTHMLAHYVMMGFYNSTENHLMRQDFCVYWQMLPTMGMLFSSILLLNVAVDRLLSTQKFYSSLIRRRYTLYISIHIAVGLVFSLSMETWIFFSRTSEIYVLCMITAPLSDMILTVFINVIAAVNICILACYLVLIFLLRRAQLSQDSSKQIHRSLLVIILTTVFGWFGPMMFAMVDFVFSLDIEKSDKLHSDLFAGLFINFACATNFFVYYSIRTYLPTIHICMCYCPTEAPAMLHHHSAWNQFWIVIMKRLELSTIIVFVVCYITNLVIIAKDLKGRNGLLTRGALSDTHNYSKTETDRYPRMIFHPFGAV
ncbi:hypothetical protein V3C99_007260 [Haemonchus contortus]